MEIQVSGYLKESWIKKQNKTAGGITVLELRFYYRAIEQQQQQWQKHHGAGIKTQDKLTKCMKLRTHI